jgi:hypothetical protein
LHNRDAKESDRHKSAIDIALDGCGTESGQKDKKLTYFIFMVGKDI